jgi:hypothetical protein
VHSTAPSGRHKRVGMGVSPCKWWLRIRMNLRDDSQNLKNRIAQRTLFKVLLSYLPKLNW